MDAIELRSAYNKGIKASNGITSLILVSKQ